MAGGSDRHGAGSVSARLSLTEQIIGHRRSAIARFRMEPDTCVAQSRLIWIPAAQPDSDPCSKYKHGVGGKIDQECRANSYHLCGYGYYGNGTNHNHSHTDVYQKPYSRYRYK
jgi:hypothetical protein